MAGGLVFIRAGPGFPKLQLFVLAGALGAGYVLQRINALPQTHDARAELSNPQAHGHAKARPTRPDRTSSRLPCRSFWIFPRTWVSLDYDTLNEELAALRRALYFDLGVPFRA